MPKFLNAAGEIRFFAETVTSDNMVLHQGNLGLIESDGSIECCKSKYLNE